MLFVICWRFSAPFLLFDNQRAMTKENIDEENGPKRQNKNNSNVSKHSMLWCQTISNGYLASGTGLLESILSGYCAAITPTNSSFFVIFSKRYITLLGLIRLGRGTETTQNRAKWNVNMTKTTATRMRDSETAVSGTRTEDQKKNGTKITFRLR